MKKVIVILFLLICKDAFCQSYSSDIIDSLYSKTIQAYFPSISTGDKLTFLITDSIPENAKSYAQASKLILVKDRNEVIHYLIKNRVKTGNIYSITQKFKNDTLDLSVNSWIINTEKRLFKRNVLILANCGGTMGYIPSGRMVYNIQTNSWKFLSYRDLIDEKRKLYSSF